MLAAALKRIKQCFAPLDDAFVGRMASRVQMEDIWNSGDNWDSRLRQTQLENLEVVWGRDRMGKFVVTSKKE